LRRAVGGRRCHIGNSETGDEGTNMTSDEV
jgi:hypothetical protein